MVVELESNGLLLPPLDVANGETTGCCFLVPDPTAAVSGRLEASPVVLVGVDSVLKLRLPTELADEFRFSRLPRRTTLVFFFVGVSNDNVVWIDGSFSMGCNDERRDPGAEEVGFDDDVVDFDPDVDDPALGLNRHMDISASVGWTM